MSGSPEDIWKRREADDATEWRRKQQCERLAALRELKRLIPDILKWLRIYEYPKRMGMFDGEWIVVEGAKRVGWRLFIPDYWSEMGGPGYRLLGDGTIVAKGYEDKEWQTIALDSIFYPQAIVRRCKGALRSLR